MSRSEPSPVTLRGPRYRRGRLQNWAGNQACAPARIARPCSETELVDLVRQARELGQRVKVVGAGHSWSDAAMTDGVSVTLDGYAAVLDIDPTARQVTMQAGIRLRDLNRVLHRHGLAMTCLGSISEQSVAGAISTATHGSGRRFGNLATAVARLRLVDGTGEVRVLHRPEAADDSDAANHFRAACVGIGALGIVSEVTLDLEPAFRLHERTENVAIGEILDPERGQRWIESVLGSAEHVKFWWLPHTSTIRVYRADRTDREATPRDLGRRFEESPLSRGLFAALLRAGAAAPPLVPAINRLVRAVHFVDGERIARSDRVFNVAQVPVHHEMEYAVSLDRAAEAFRVVRGLIARERVRVNFIVEARFVAADDLFLSPARARPSCQLGAYAFPGPDSTRYFHHFERAMLALGGRPHWGKSFAAGHEAIGRNQGGLAAFLAVRDALDPDRVFANAFTERVLGA